MKKDEYYLSEEFSRGPAEYREFSAEVYAKTTDYTPTPPEVGKTGAEYSVETDVSSSPRVSERRKTARERSKKFLDRLHGSTHAAGGVGTVAGAVGTVAVVATVVVGVVELQPKAEPLLPKMEMVSLVTGADCMQYALLLEEPAEGVEYRVVIGGENGEQMEFAVEQGRNERVVSALSPTTKYTLEIIGTSETTGQSTVCYQQEFVTLDASYRTAFFTVSESTYEGADALEYSVYVSDLTKTDGQYTLNVSYGETVYYSDDNLTAEGYFEGVVPEPLEGEFVFSVDDVQSGGTNTLATYRYEYVYGEGEAPVPEIELTGTPILRADGSVEVEYGVRGAESLQTQYGTLRVKAQYDTGEMEQVVLENVALNEFGTLLLTSVPSVATAVTISAEYSYLTQGGWTNEGRLDSQEITLPLAAMTGVTVYSEYGNAEFAFLTRGDAVGFVVAEDGTEYEAVDGLANFALSDGVGVYEYGARTADGREVIERQSVTLQTGVSAEYTFQYKNPGDVLTTYNEDGTINIYIQTDFASEDAEVYYEIEYSSSETGVSGVLASREAVWALEGVPLGEYVIVYNIYKEIDGVRYVLRNIAVSGTTGTEPLKIWSVSVTATATGTGKALEILLDTLPTYEFDSIRLTLDDGTEIALGENDFALTDDGFYHRAVVDVGADVQMVRIGMKACGYSGPYEEIAALFEIKGDRYAWVEFAYDVSETV